MKKGLKYLYFLCIVFSIGLIVYIGLQFDFSKKYDTDFFASVILSSQDLVVSTKIEKEQFKNPTVLCFHEKQNLSQIKIADIFTYKNGSNENEHIYNHKDSGFNKYQYSLKQKKKDTCLTIQQQNGFFYRDSTITTIDYVIPNFLDHPSISINPSFYAKTLRLEVDIPGYQIVGEQVEEIDGHYVIQRRNQGPMVLNLDDKQKTITIDSLYSVPTFSYMEWILIFFILWLIGLILFFIWLLFSFQRKQSGSLHELKYDYSSIGYVYRGKVDYRDYLAVFFHLRDVGLLEIEEQEMIFDPRNASKLTDAEREIVNLFIIGIQGKNRITFSELRQYCKINQQHCHDKLMMWAQFRKGETDHELIYDKRTALKNGVVFYLGIGLILAFFCFISYWFLAMMMFLLCFMVFILIQKMKIRTNYGMQELNKWIKVAKNLKKNPENEDLLYAIILGKETLLKQKDKRLYDVLKICLMGK